jgi:putative membrane protein
MLPTYIYNYVIYLLASLAMMSVFSLIYTKITPYDEIKMIREGKAAAALSFLGALIGFSLTLASSILHNDSFVAFAAWAGAAMIVQLAVYTVLSRLIPDMHDCLEKNNVAMGALLGGVSLTFGIINAACLS